MSRPGIVIVGPERAGKRTLIAGLQQLNGPDATTGATVGSSTKDVIPIHLETKYYSASLELRVLPASEFHTPGPASSAALEGAEGLLLVLDATQSFPVGAAERWSELAAEASLGCQLCIANKMDAAGEGGAAAAFYKHVVAWALDHGFEPVECVATQPAATAEERDKTSVARVLEALQSNMWSNLERHAAPKAVGGGAALMAGAGFASRGAGAGAGSGAPSGADALAARGGFLMSADEDSEGEGAAGSDRGAGAGSSSGAGGGAAGFDLAEALEGLDDDDIDGDDDAARALRAAVTGTSLADSGAPASADAGADGAAAPSTSAADATAGGAGVAAKPAAAVKAGAAKKDEAALARDIDADFTKMVEEVRRVRDSAKGGQMNDDQRREAAALVTMRLMAMLGGLGGEDDDDEDEEGGGSAAPTGKGRGASGSKAAGAGGAGAKKGRK